MKRTIISVFFITGISSLRVLNAEISMPGFDINGLLSNEIKLTEMKIPEPSPVPDALLEAEKHNRAISVESIEGVKISLDFKTTVIQEDWVGQDIAAKPLAISVSNLAFNETDKVKIALKAWCKAHDGQIVSKTHKLELSYAGKGKFTGIIKEGVMLYSDYAGQYYHNLVITVNGRRLHNLKDNSDSFNIDFGFDPSRKNEKTTISIKCLSKGTDLKISGSLNKKGGELKIYAPQTIYNGMYDGETCRFERQIRPNEDSLSYAKFVSGDSTWFFFKLSLPKSVFKNNEKDNFKAYFTVQHDEVGGPEEYELNCNSEIK